VRFPALNIVKIMLYMDWSGKALEMESKGRVAVNGADAPCSGLAE